MDVRAKIKLGLTRHGMDVESAVPSGRGIRSVRPGRVNRSPTRRGSRTEHLIGPPETTEDQRQIVSRDCRAGIRHGNRHLACALRHSNGDAAASRCVYLIALSSRISNILRKETSSTRTMLPKKRATFASRCIEPEMDIQTAKTPVLRLAYEESGPAKGEPLILVHGWPDSPRTWDKVLPSLHEAGFKTIAPYLRGYGPSTFRSPILGRRPRRTGQPVAFAQDIIDLADRLRFKRFQFVGHDWGARTGYALAALYPHRLKSLVAISVPFEPGKAAPPKFPQARAFWYQWLLCTKPGEKKFRKDPVAFGRAQWDTWSSPGWYSSSEFDEAAKSWKGADFQEVVLHGYRSRWGHAELDPRYATSQAQFESTRTLSTPTLLLHGAEDNCELAETTDGAGLFFTGAYRRVLLDAVGHFPQRENPHATTNEIVKHVRVANKLV